MERECLALSVLLLAVGLVAVTCRQRTEPKPPAKPPQRTAWEAMAAAAEPAAYCEYMHRMMSDPNVPVRERQRRWQQCQKVRQDYQRQRQSKGK